MAYERITTKDVAKCDTCYRKFKRGDEVYDAKTKMGPWANMCRGCFDRYGVGLGLGKGQVYTIVR